MPDTPPRQVTIRIGRDAKGPVIVGDDNRVGTGTPAEPAPGSEQSNRANDHGTVYAVTDGDMHVHHDNTPAPAPQEPPAR
ncbi:hypothetical protein [Streptomyces sp. PvR034]|uniref:hypothetical protein n=1 Tax=Streptomyces sp. PvR034 TaxID=3156401 RepID=UPI0033933F2D